MKKRLTLFMVALVAVAAFAGLRRAATNVTIDFTDGGVITAMGYTLPELGKAVDLTEAVTYQGITITPHHASTKTRFWNASGEYQLRYYATGGITISVPEGNKINQIVISGNTALEKTDANVGTVEHSKDNKSLTWTPAEGAETSSVQFIEAEGGKTTNVISIVVSYEAAGTATRTVYFENDGNWAKVNVYAWNDQGDVTSAWPGDEITPVDGVYSWSTTGAPTQIIFNNGAGIQTGDLEFEDGATYNSKGKVVPEPELKDFSVTFTTDAGWENVYAYAWNEDNTPLVQWPGVEITATKNSEGVYTYAFQAATAPVGIIFNNGLEGDAKRQTADLTFENGKAYSYSASKDVTSLDFTTVDVASVPSEYVGTYGNLDNFTIADADQGVKMLIKNNEAANNSRFWNNNEALQLRVYNGATLTFEPIEEGKVIKKITFDASNWGTENSTDVETLTDKEWAGSAAKVVLTIAGGKTFVNKITVEVGDAPVLNTYTATFKNEASWNAVYAYAWTTTGEGDAATTKEYLGGWPGTPLTFNSETGLFDVVINATEAPANILFHSSVEGEKTADLEFENGKQYTNKAEEPQPATISKVEIRGGKVGDWDAFSKDIELVLGEDGVYSAVLDLTELTGSDYAFKLVVTPSGGEPIWIGTGSDLVLNGDYVYKDPETVDKDLNLFHHNANFATYIATATWNPNSNAASGWTLTIDGKDPRQSESLFTYHVVGTADLCGAEWLATANEMTKNAESGLYEWSAQGITVSATSQPEFKIAVNNNADPENVETVAWYPVSDATGANNWVITPEYLGDEGVYTITITFNAETKEISVVGERTGDVPEPVPTPLYTLEVGNTFKSGETIEVKERNGEEVVATITYGEAGEGYADFKAAKADSHVPGYTAFTEGNGTNGDKAGGTFYTIVPKYDGTVSVAVVLNADKKFYIEEEGTALEGYNEMTVAEKYYGTFEFEVKAGKSYKVYCAGSKLGFYGFDYTYEKSDTYTVVGTEDLTGYDWDKTKNEMTLNAETGQYEWKAENISVSDKAQPAFKIVKNAGKDDEAWYPEGDGTTNWVITPEYLGAEGVYTISIAFNAATKDITVTGEKTGEIEPVTPVIPDGTYYVMNANFGTLINAEGALDAKGTPITFTFNAANNAYTIEGSNFFGGKLWTVAEAIEGLSGFFTFSNADGFAAASQTMALEQITDGTADEAIWILLQKAYWEDIVNSTYTVAGTKDLTGTENDWDVVESNNMTYNDISNLFEITYKNITVNNDVKPAFKVVQTDVEGKQTWYPEGDETTNWVITPEVVGGEGLFDITITFDPSDSKEIKVSAVQIEPELALGDVNGDTEVTTTDAVMAVDFALAKSVPTTAQFNAANVVKAAAGDEEAITVADAIGIVDIALGKSNGDAAGARLYDERNNFLTLNGQTLSLTNTTAFAGFQMDVTLAEGAQFNGAQLTERASNLMLVYNRIGENTWRIIALSLQANTISGNDGALLKLDITGSSTVSVTNIEFADAEANAYALGFGGATGINGVYGVSADSDIYNVNGVRSNTLRKGMNIIRSANGEVKKVFVK